MELLEKKMLVETILQIGAFNYKTGNITSDIENNWNKVYKDKPIMNNIEITFERFLKYYYQMYTEHKSNLPQSKVALSIFLKELLIKKIIMNIYEDTTYEEFCDKAIYIFKTIKLDVKYDWELSELKENFDELNQYVKRMKLLEKDIDKILILLSEKLEIEDVSIYQKVEFRIINKSVSRIERRNPKFVKNNKFESKNNDLKEQIRSLQQEINNLYKLYEQLQEDYKVIEDNNDKLRNKLYELKQNKSKEKYENIKELIENLDEKKLDYPLSNLYIINKFDEKDLRKIKSRINDLFIALDSYGIEPYIEKNDDEFTVDEKDICIKYRLNNDISNSKIKKGKYSLPGWLYNGKMIILPLVELIKEKKEGIKDE